MSLEEHDPAMTVVTRRTTEVRVEEALRSLRVQGVKVERDIIDRHGRFKLATIGYTVEEFAEKIADALEEVDRLGSIQARADAVARSRAREAGDPNWSEARA